MLFAVITTGLAIAVGLILVGAMRRASADPRTAAQFDLAVYRDQLSEIDRDLQRGVLAEDEAERARVEVSRRILAADKAATSAGAAEDQIATAPLTSSTWVAGLMALPVLVLGCGLYIALGAPGYGDMPQAKRIEAARTYADTRDDQATAAARALAEGRVQQVPPRPDLEPLVVQLREAVSLNLPELQGFEFLASGEASLGNFSAAAAALEVVIALKGDTVQAQDHFHHAEMMIFAAGGYVSPEAEAALIRAIDVDPEMGEALYYLGLLNAQIDRPDRAFIIWKRLLDDTPESSPWIPAIRAQIEEIADRAGVARFELNPLGGPTADDIAGAQNLSPAERMEMIRGMVASLSDRLATEGGTAQEWARLINAHVVLGNRQQAMAIYSEATEVFENVDDAIALLEETARDVGLIE